MRTEAEIRERLVQINHNLRINIESNQPDSKQNAQGNLAEIRILEWILNIGDRK